MTSRVHPLRPTASGFAAILAAATTIFAGAGCSIIRDFDAFQAATDAGVADGGVVDPPDTGPPPITRAEYNTELARTLCRRATFCEPKASFAERILQFTCSESVVSDPNLQQDPFFRSLFSSIRLFGGPMASLRPAEAAACLEALDTNDCAILSKPLPEVCRRVWRGTVPLDGLCRSDTDCVDGRCEVDSLAASCGGICVPFVRDAEACTGPEECAPGFVCREASCQPPGGNGDACDSNIECGPELWCPRVEAVCRPQPTAGEVCERRGSFFGAEDPCASLLVCGEDGSGTSRCRTGGAQGDDCGFEDPCSPGLRCDDDTARCVAVSDQGEACESTINCPLLLECVNRGGEFRCVPRPALGEACSPLLPCAVGVCDDMNECALLSEGEECTGSQAVTIRECEGFCDTAGGGGGTCARLRGIGSPCRRDTDCREGAFCETTEGLCTAC